MTAATPASDRYAAAQKALAAYDADPTGRARENALHDCVGALRALITPPATEETAEQIADDVMDEFAARTLPSDTVASAAQIIRGSLEDAVRAGIQAAWESWQSDDYAPIQCSKCGVDL